MYNSSKTYKNINERSNIIDFPNKIEDNDSKIIEEVALECLKKSNFSGSTDDFIAEYTRVLHQLKQSGFGNRKIKFGNQLIEEKDTIHDDYIICLKCGKKMQMLKRHLLSNHNMSFEDYKQKWGLSVNYPFVCKNYANIRSGIAYKTHQKNKN